MNAITTETPRALRKRSWRICVTNDQYLKIFPDGFGALRLYWLVSARGTEKATAGEAFWWRLIRLPILAIAFLLLLSPWLRFGVLGWRFIPENSLLRGLGLVLTLAGPVLCVWARICLGEFWSDKVVLKVGHELIRGGPYAYLRHPIYSGVLLGIAGTALVIGEWCGIVALVLMWTSYFLKARRGTDSGGRFW